MDEDKMLLLIDNYDSFTWNLVHYLMELGAEVERALWVVPGDVASAARCLIESVAEGVGDPRIA